MIADAPALRALCAELHDAPWVALDTEFVREDTYWAQLCLIQVATPARVACIDPLALDDLAPLLALLHDPQVTKVLHSASQDLEIFHHLDGRVPAPVFDTQLAAPLLGHGEQVGFSRLVADVLGVELDKSQSRTDWHERPLPAAAVEYAANDVRYLVPLYEALQAELERRGRLAWVAAEMAELTRPERYERSADTAWQRLRGVERLPPAGRAVARDVAAWREETARARDVPRGRVLRDDVILDLARTRPRNRRQLERIRGLRGGVAERYGQRLLEIVAAARAADAPPVAGAGREPPLDAAGEALVDALAAVVRLRAAQEELGAQTLAGRKELVRIARGEPVANVLGGWRATVVGTDIAALLEGRKALIAGPEGLRLVDNVTL